jgi:hypothetical protein
MDSYLLGFQKVQNPFCGIYMFMLKNYLDVILQHGLEYYLSMVRMLGLFVVR